MNVTGIADSEIYSSIRQHLQNFWPKSAITEKAWQRGPIRLTVPGLKILRLVSTTPRRPTIYATSGCFIVRPPEQTRHEFFLISPSEEEQHVETLTMLADFHANPKYRLTEGSIVNIGSPWIPGSTCEHLLMSLPYPYGPKLEWLKLPNYSIQFLWALPITAREAAFAELYGHKALEEKFEAAQFNYQDPVRASVV